MNPGHQWAHNPHSQWLEGLGLGTAQALAAEAVDVVLIARGDPRPIARACADRGLSVFVSYGHSGTVALGPDAPLTEKVELR